MIPWSEENSDEPDDVQLTSDKKFAAVGTPFVVVKDL